MSHHARDMNQNQHPDFEEVGADERPASATTAQNSRTEGEQWIEAYRGYAMAWMLRAISEGAVEGAGAEPDNAVTRMLQAIAEAAVEGAEAEPDIPLWPDPGTP